MTLSRVKPRVVTLGCRLNSFESEVMREAAENQGLADTVIVNTCAVTTEAERQARQTIRKLKRENPNAAIVVTGCAAQLHPERFAEMPEVSRVLGNAEKLDPAMLSDTTEVVVSDIMELGEAVPHLIHGFDGRARAFVEVQQGCDHRCTFCIIPFARGPNRTIDPARIIEQVQTLVDQGFKEVVLTGVDVSSYGEESDGWPKLGEMTRNLLTAVPDLPRLRLTSLDPANMDDAIFDLLADEPRFMPHLHLSLQACDDMVLKRMKRRHSRDHAAEICARARNVRPDVTLGADLIAGFPTETDDQFENTLRAIDEFGLTFLHVFPYSARPGTPAAKMPQVAKQIRKDRAARLRQAGEAAKRRFFDSRIGTEAEVLVERNGLGHSEHYAPVQLSEDAEDGTLVRVRITGYTDDALTGETIS